MKGGGEGPAGAGGLTSGVGEDSRRMEGWPVAKIDVNTTGQFPIEIRT